MTGHEKDTAEWLGWLQNGGWYGEEPNALAPMPAFWQNAPVGGEFTSSIPMKTMLRSQLSQTVELVQQSHMSFLGPKVSEETYRGGYNAVLKNLGYRLRVTQLTLTPLEGARLSLSGKNGGQRLTLGIVDPMTGRDAVRFAMKTKIRNGRAVLI